MKSIKKILAVIFVLSLVLCFAACDEKTKPSVSPSASGAAAVNTYYSDVDEIIFGEYIAKGGSFELAISGDQGKLTYVQRDLEGSFTNISTLIITGTVSVTGNKVEFNSDIFTQGVTHATKWGIEGEVENYDELMQQFRGRLQTIGLTAQQIDDFCSGKELILTEAMGDFVDVCIAPFSYKSFKAEINGDGFAFTEMTAHSAYSDESNLSVTYYESGKVKELVAIDQEGAYKEVSTYGEDGLLLSNCYYVSDNKGGWVELGDGQTE